MRPSPAHLALLLLAACFSGPAALPAAAATARLLPSGAAGVTAERAFGGYDVYDHIDPSISRFSSPTSTRTDLSQWVDVTTEALACSSDTRDKKGVAFVDFDGDGDLDLCTVGEGEHGITLLRNDAGVFTEVTPGSLLFAASGSSQSWGDFDNDGDPDLAFVPEEDRPFLFRNNGDGSFTDVTPTGMLVFAHGHSSSWVDFDRDGRLDFYVANLGRISTTPGRLYRQEAAGGFADVTADSLGVPFGDGVAWGDFDGDRDPDVFLARFSNKQDLLLRNDQGIFNDVTSAEMMDQLHGHSCAVADYDNDLDLDIFVSNANGPNRLYQNDGSGRFIEATPPAMVVGIHSVGMSWGDYDNDGLQDLFVTLTDGGQSRMFHNDGSGAFSEVAAGPLTGTGYAAGSAAGDYDQDGDLDLYVSSYLGRPNQLFRNDLANGNHWLQIDLEGTVSNRSGIGARIVLEAGGQLQMREISGCTGFRSQNALTAHFGLGEAALIERIDIIWPSGIVQETTLVVSDQRLHIVERGVLTDAGLPRIAGTQIDATPNPFLGSVRLSFALPQAGDVRLQVLDLAGRVVRTIEDQIAFEPGRHSRTWDARDDHGRRVPEGVYFVRIATPWEQRLTRIVSLGGR